MSGDGDRTAQHHPVPGQYPSQAAALWRTATPTPCPGGAPTQRRSDAQQWQAMWRRGARPAGAETGTGGRPSSSRLHAHPSVPRVPPLPGPAGATVAGAQRGEPGVGQDHQQQRARVVAAAEGRTVEPGGEVGGLTLQVPSLRIQDSMTLQRIRACCPSRRQIPALWQRGLSETRRCTHAAETLSLVGTRTHLLPESLSLTLK